MSSAQEEKLKKIYGTYDKLEKLFKVSQMVQRTFHIPVLNEYRYLSRALIEYHTTNEVDVKERALSKLEVAIAAAYNDIVDSLLITIKFALEEYYTNYPYVNVNEVLQKYEVSDVKHAIVVATKIVVSSRENRQSRFEQYEAFSQSADYNVLVEFGMSLHMIEYELHGLNNQSQDGQFSALVNDINSAFKNHYLKNDKYPRFELEYQPKYDADVTIKSAEALVRLYVKENMKISPLSFLYVVQNSERDGELDTLVLEKAIEAVKELKNNNIIDENFCLAVNVMPKTIANDFMYIEHCNTLVTDNDIAKNISLEIIESWDSDKEEHIKVHYRLGSLNKDIKIAIDDFGTGSTKLEYISMIDNLECIKIDKRLVDNLITNNKDKALNLIKGIVALAKETNLKIVVEGVENAEQFDLLKPLGINLYQGFHFSKPVNFKEFINLLKKQ